MDVQTLINILISIVGATGGWILKSVTDSVKELQITDTKLADKVASIEVLVAGQYCKREDLEKMTTALFQKLDRIEDKLDSKVDK